MAANLLLIMGLLFVVKLPGGIIPPADAVAAITVLKGPKVPRRMIATLDGEERNKLFTATARKQSILSVLKGAVISFSKGNSLIPLK